MTRTPVLVDLYCKAGGAAKGYAQAGFTVIGVDREPQPRYPFMFIRADVLALSPDFLRSLGDAIHASPPCQAHSAMKTMPDAKKHLDLIPQTRALLQASGLPWVMENVPGSTLVDPVRLCGSMFGLGAGGAQLRRHRDFEASFPLRRPGPCAHASPTMGIYGGHVRNRRRREGSENRGVADFTQAEGNAAMGIDWMTLGELSEAIPPAYTRFIGAQLLEHVA